MVTAGLLGRKSGQGFYTYDAAGLSDGRRRSRSRRRRTPTAAATRPIETVGVVGSGTMATGIVEVFAKAGYE